MKEHFEQFITTKDYESTYEQLLINDKSFCIHHQNIHKLMIEIYKVFNNITDKFTAIFLSELVITLI